MVMILFSMILTNMHNFLATAFELGGIYLCRCQFVMTIEDDACLWMSECHSLYLSLSVCNYICTGVIYYEEDTFRQE